MRTREQLNADLLEIVRRQQTDYLMRRLKERQKYMQWLYSKWLAQPSHYPDAFIEFKVTMEFCDMIRAELFVRHGSQ